MLPLTNPNSFLSFASKKKETTLPILFRIHLKLENLKLKRYKKLAEKIPELEYKTSDPEGWLADQFVTKAEKFLDGVLVEIQDGKELPKRKLKKLTDVQAALLWIACNKTGRKYQTAKELVEDFVPILLGDLADILKNTTELQLVPEG